VVAVLVVDQDITTQHLFKVLVCLVMVMKVAKVVVVEALAVEEHLQRVILTAQAEQEQPHLLLAHL
jgi:hypothetical protein